MNADGQGLGECDLTRSLVFQQEGVSPMVDFANNFRFRGQFDVSEIRALLHDADESEWLDSVARLAPVHRASRGIFLKNDIKTEHLYGTIHGAWFKYHAAVARSLETLRRGIDAGYYVRLQFSRHMPGHGFDPHVDTFSFTLTHSHRIHLPICTNDDVWFSVGDERKHMKEGEAWEINNARVHAGHNGGSTPRVHMIVDLARPLESVGERVGYAINRLATGSPGAMLIFRPQLDGEPDPSTIVNPAACAPGSAVRVAPDVIVGVNYRLTETRTGAVLLEDDTAEPLQYAHGHAQLPAAFEAVLAGLGPGDQFSVEVPPERAFGLCDPNLVAHVTANRLERQARGYAVDGVTPFAVFAQSHDGRTHTLNANHPLAGLALRFEGTIRHIRSLAPDEHAHAIYEGPTFATGIKAREAVQQFACGLQDFDIIDSRGMRSPRPGGVRP